MQAFSAPTDRVLATYSVTEAARLLGLHVKTVRRWAQAGKLGYELTPTGRYRIACADVDRLVPALAPRPIVRPPFLSLRETARRLEVDERTVRRWLHSGRLPGVQRGLLGTDPWQIPEAEVERIRQGGPMRLPTRTA